MPIINVGGIGFGRKSLIKSIQRGVIELTGTSNTATINSVDTSNVILLHLGNASSITDLENVTVRLALTNSTTVTGVRGDGNGVAHVSFEVIELYPGIIKSIQSGTITITGGVEETDTITSVDTAKSMLLNLGQVSKENVPEILAYLTLTNSTTVTFEHDDTTLDVTAGYMVVEFY